MGYSCCDFTDDVFAELHRVGAISEAEFNDDNLPDNASLQAEYALKGIARLVGVSNAAAGAKQFFRELLDSVETLGGIAEQHGPRTLAGLMNLQSAILNGGFIDQYSDESALLEIVCALPSGEQWAKYIRVEDRGAPACQAITSANGVLSPGSEVQVLSGYFGCQGTILRADFVVSAGATTAEKDAAFMAALAEQADIDYVAIGEAKVSR